MSIESWKKEFYPTPAKDNISYPLQAAKHSLAKWLGLTPENLKDHVLTKDFAEIVERQAVANYFGIDCSTCALCEYDDKLVYIDEQGCYNCPLFQHTGISCNDDESPYVTFLKTDDPTKMIEELDSTVKWLTAKELGENNV
jgi:hypothetical protein